ncbi:carcinoembryonic antigen-related cell adhesion molecule 20-like isoform X2 [Lampris incognitus]|nr:carcinoembryonic antigen-related cell adhesion molecule 20-like isoform X2 [Lampris incognitus]
MHDSVQMSCEADWNRTGWTVLRNTSVKQLQRCKVDWGSLKNNICSISAAYPWNSGAYWCQSDSGDRSSVVHLIVHDGPVILESPVLPVMEGDDVTLRCSTKTPPSSLSADFYKDDILIRTESTGQMTIHHVSKTNEGLYKCQVSNVGESPGSRMTVRDRDFSPDSTTPLNFSLTTPSAPPMSEPPSLSASRLMYHLVVAAPYLLSTITLGLIYLARARASATDKEAGVHGVTFDVIMEVE